MWHLRRPVDLREAGTPTSDDDKPGYIEIMKDDGPSLRPDEGSAQTQNLGSLIPMSLSSNAGGSCALPRVEPAAIPRTFMTHFILLNTSKSLNIAPKRAVESKPSCSSWWWPVKP